MQIDALNEFCDGTAIPTVAPGTNTKIGNAIDIAVPFGDPSSPTYVVGDPGAGNPLYVVIQVETACTSGGAATSQFRMVSSAAEALTTVNVHWTTTQFSLADMATVGKVIAVIALPGEGEDYLQWLGIQQYTGTAAFSGGTLNAFITGDPSRWKALPSGTPTPA